MLNLRSLAAALALATLLSPGVHAAYSDKTFTVTNIGNGPLTITGATVTGNAAEFALLPGHNCTTVAAGGNCSMTVRFTPAGSGPRAAAALTYSSNGTNGPTHSIALAGAGSEPTHLYWRVVFIGITPNQFSGAPNAHASAEIDFRATAGGTDLASGGTAIASSYQLYSEPYRAFDNITSGGMSWASATSNIGEWIGYQFPAPVQVRQLWYLPSYFGSLQSAPSAIAIEHSDNGTSWTRVREFTGLNWSLATPKTFDF